MSTEVLCKVFQLCLMELHIHWLLKKYHCGFHPNAAERQMTAPGSADWC